MDDLAAIKRLRRGDLNGLSVLVERYQVQAVRTAYLITRDRSQAEDVVQGAFVRLVRSIASYDMRRPFAPWFMRSVVNAAVQAAQRDQRYLDLDGSREDDVLTFADSLPDPAPSPDDLAEARALRDAVGAALAHLPPEQRAAIVMRYYLDMPESRMSDALNVPPARSNGGCTQHVNNCASCCIGS
ncbi:MAG: sigma-70 family RNA polymerase sigma factor [Anaerolineae bacterium]